jgi:hypothetical protein
MNQKSFILAAILAATALSVIATPLAYAQNVADPGTGDSSATLTGQNVQQKNVGSYRAEQNNCASNGIDHSDVSSSCNNNNN